MKKLIHLHLIPVVLIVLMSTAILEVKSQTPGAISIDLRLSADSTMLEFHVKSNGMTFSGGPNQIGYGIKWPISSGASLGTQELLCPVALPFQQYNTLENDGYNYAWFISVSGYALSDPAACPDKIWLADQWILIHRVAIDDPSGNFQFELARDYFTEDNNMIPYMVLWGVEYCEPQYGCEGGLFIGNINRIEGQLFLDANQNGEFNGDDLPIQNRTVSVGNGQYRSTNAEGAYTSFWVPAGIYSLTAAPGTFDAQAQPIPMVEFSAGSSDSALVDIAMLAPQMQTDLGLAMIYSSPVPGFTNSAWIDYKNHGTTVTGGTLTFTFSNEQEYVGSLPTGTVNGNTVSWSVETLQLGEIGEVSIGLYTPATVPLGTQVVYTAIIESTVQDDFPENDQVSPHVTVVGSFDPNDKLVTPEVLTPAEVTEGKAVTYTIRFQNTGTYFAQNVRIEDELPEDLDVSTFEFLGSSHDCEWMIQNGHLEFHFNGIMLPDSGADLLGSQGHVIFKITPNSDLQLGDVVENSAAIYFDFNEPVITEPAVFTVETSTGISDLNNEEIKLWPNPSTGILHLEFNGAPTGELVILDLLGRPVHQQRISIGTTSMDLSDLSSGNYIVHIDSDSGSHRSRLVKN